MKNLFKIVLSIIIFALSSCASTHGQYVTDREDAWIDGYSSKSNGADKGLLYCRANVKEKGLADPICFEARFEEYEDEVEKLAEEQKEKEEIEKESKKQSQEDVFSLKDHLVN